MRNALACFTPFPSRALESLGLARARVLEAPPPVRQLERQSRRGAAQALELGELGRDARAARGPARSACSSAPSVAAGPPVLREPTASSTCKTWVQRLTSSEERQNAI